jgi:aspartate aminotransferase
MTVSLSRRGEAMPASPIRRLAPFADAAKSRGVEILHLNIGQPDVDSPPEFFAAIRAFEGGYLAYSPSQGIQELREAAAEDYRRRGIDVLAGHVLVTTAGSEALVFAMTACLDGGEEVIVPEPMYANYIGFAGMADVRVAPITTRIEEGFALPGPEAFAERINERTRAILICNPGNPTGRVYSEEQLRGLAELCRERGLFLIADEVYRDFNYTGRPLLSALQIGGLDDRSVMIDSASKRFSLCGARLGFAVTRSPELMGAMTRMAQARLSPPGLAQIGVLGALKTPRTYYEEVREEYRLRRDLLVSRLQAIPGAVVPPIDGAFYATVRLPIDDGDRFAAWLLSEFSHEGATVMLAPASGFYSTPGLGRDEVRIAYVLKRERLTQAMDILEAALAAYPGRTA